MPEQRINARALPEGYRLGDYVIDHPLGQGRLGVTYLAHGEGGDTVVIKECQPLDYTFRDQTSRRILPLNDSEDCRSAFDWTLNSFYMEACLLASVDHPGIAKVVRAFRALDTAYYVMPYVEGESLDRWLDRHGTPNRGTTVRLLVSILSALDYLHGRNLLHRDIKPQNIIVQSDGTPVLVDFGTARYDLGERTAACVGTPDFCAFEQLQKNGKCGPWTDVYAIGATFYLVVTGKQPPQSRDRVPDDRLGALKASPKLVSRYGEALLAGIDKALSLSPRKRWQSAEEWRNSLGVAYIPPQRLNPGTAVDIHDFPLRSVDKGGVASACGVSVCAEPRKKQPKKLLAAILIALAGVVVLGGATVALACWGRGDTRNGALACWGRGDTRNGAESVQAAAGNVLEPLMLAAARGDVGAMNKIGECYECGRVVAWSGEEACRWYRKAAEAGSLEAMCNLSRCYISGEGVEKDAQEALRWARKAADAGYPRGWNAMGVMYETGLGVEKDYPAAVGLFQKAYDAGCVHACNSIGRCYESGHGLPQDKREAVSWYRKAAERGLPDAMHNLGLCYAEGAGVEKDAQEAALWFLRASEAGYTKSINSLGYCYAEGQGVKRDFAEAKRLFLEAASRGNTCAMRNLAWYYERKDGVEHDSAKSLEWYRKAAEAGDAAAQYRVALCYENGVGADKDAAKAVEWYAKAAENGNVAAQVGLGLCYANAWGTGRDDTKAAAWFLKAAGTGDARAQLYLAACYASGRGVPKNEGEAAKWCRKAAEAGDAESQFLLGELYEYGQGVGEDVEEALVWYGKAAKQGHQKAEDAIKRLRP